MKNRANHLRPLLGLLLTMFALLGCGLFDTAAGERQEENEAIAQNTVLGQVVTAEGIGEQNAPVGVTDTFNSSQDFVYVVAEADRIEQGTTMFARWYYEDEPLEDSSEITADRDYEDTYVEFHLENLAAQMEPGDYRVQLFVNGNPTEEVAFTVE